MNTLTKGFCQSLENVEGFTKGQKIVLAISGGLDSTAMLWLFHEVAYQYGLQLVVAHYNHNLRGLESDGDEAFVKALAETLQLPFYSARPQEGYWQSSQGNKMDRARRLRYAFFQELAQKVDAQWIALAHHGDDQAETILFQLLRGSGLKGLAGMPLYHGNLMRPLLPFRRQELEDYMKSQSKAWRDDSSNESLEYSRNRLRHQVMPLLKSFNPRFVESINRTAELVRAEDRYLEQCAIESFEKIVAEESIHVPSLQKEALALQRRVLQIYLQKKLPSAFIGLEKIDEILHKLRLEVSANGEVTQVAGHRVIREGQLVKLLKDLPQNDLSYAYKLSLPLINEGRTVKSIPEAFGTVTLSYYEINEEKKSFFEAFTKQSNKQIFLDEKVLQAGDLVVRSRQRGDRFYPTGMDGSKKIKDFLIDKKIPRWERQHIPLLVAGKEVIWLMGYRADRRYVANRESRGVIEVRWDKNI
ncbi:tRNA lysidine(34) synthetase TilS [Heliorestis acidaminivorans]|uniref:tRNA(Ile)-lysidine synthase n=1 Tax=Heliorestis acidaminivorans TaxID=553427 RepID=A0A6I0F3P3_9FIRM|nr:tRNA lysidine(34) synthetase TilS [Heliorestis acidaminivorans]KAB2953071.1 tRNA lysidine(34) synthetase TilS [Heliorestis acidaminivorans]